MKKLSLYIFLVLVFCNFTNTANAKVDGEGELYLSEGTIKKFIEYIRIDRDKKPDIFYTSDAKDLNIDHRITCDATVTACRPSSFFIKEILSFEIFSSTEWTFSYDFKPNYFVNIEKELNLKMNAMKKYKNELKKFPHPRSLENINNSAKRWGTVCGFNAAEAFQIVRKIQM